MQHRLAALGLLLFSTIAGCEAGPAAVREPPRLTVTSPTRHTVQASSGQVVVTGTVAPSNSGEPIASVLVNDVAATIDASGAFSASVAVGDGATLIRTVARDAGGNTASDTRAVQAGAMRTTGSNIPRAVTAALSADAFAKLSAAAGPLLKSIDMKALLAPMQPMLGDAENDCNFAQLYVDDLKFSDIRLNLTPVDGGLTIRVEIDNLDVPMRARYRGVCLPVVNQTARVTATRVTIAGTLRVTPNGMAGFAAKLVNPDVVVTGFHLTASGVVDDILNLFDLENAIGGVIAIGAELALGPLFNQALGALSGPQQIDLLGAKLELQVAPAAVQFATDGALVALDMKAQIAGANPGPGFVYTENGTPTLSMSAGFQLGLADDLANAMLASIQGAGMLDLTMPVATNTFDSAVIKLTLPPTVSADLADGKLRLVLGDALATFMSRGEPVGRAAINARIDLAVRSVGGTTVALDLGEPEIHINVVDDIANQTGLDGEDLAIAVGATLDAQLTTIRALLSVIPVPAIAGLQLRDLSIGADSGYVMVRANL